MFYPKHIEFEGNTMNLTMEEKEMITSWFIDIFELKHKSSKVLSSELLYIYGENNEKGEDWHAKCDGHINTFQSNRT